MPPCLPLFRAVSAAAAFTFSSVKGGVAVSACMGLSGRLSEVTGLEQKIRGAHAGGLTHVIISDENAHDGLVAELVTDHAWGLSYDYQTVQLEKSVRQAITVLSAPTIFDVLDLCLVVDDPEGTRCMLRGGGGNLLADTQG
jgi:predicted ATP-dependent protease